MSPWKDLIFVLLIVVALAGIMVVSADNYRRIDALEQAPVYTPEEHQSEFPLGEKRTLRAVRTGHHVCYILTQDGSVIDMECK